MSCHRCGHEYVQAAHDTTLEAMGYEWCESCAAKLIDNMAELLKLANEVIKSRHFCSCGGSDASARALVQTNCDLLANAIDVVLAGGDFP